jgi:hypothetical protein
VSGGLFVRRARTVREEGTDRPKLLPEPPVMHREKRTVHDGPADHPSRHRPSGTLVRTVRKLHAPKIHRLKRIERMALKNSHEHEEQPGCQAPRGRSAVTSRTVHQVRNQHSRETRETTSNFRSTDLPNHMES